MLEPFLHSGGTFVDYSRREVKHSCDLYNNDLKRLIRMCGEHFCKVQIVKRVADSICSEMLPSK